MNNREQLSAAQRSFDLRSRAASVVEEDRLHRQAQFNRYCDRHGIGRYEAMPEATVLKAMGAT